MTEITEILYQYVQGMSQRKMVELVGTSRNTIKKILDKAKSLGLTPGEMDDDVLLAVSVEIQTWLSGNLMKSSGPAQQQLQAHHEQIKQWLVEPYMTVRQVMRLLRELTPPLDVSETSLHRYIKKHFPKPIASTSVLHTLPGEQAQVDFGYAGKIKDPDTGKMRRMYAFVMTLAYSRLRFVRFVYRQDVATWINCHVRAFNFLGGVPQTVLLDNLKAGVIKPDIYDPLINRSYAECARYYKFIVDPAKVRTPTHKGKVERSIQIVRQQIIAGREFDSIGALNHYTIDWCKNIIANEVTRTTGESPRQRFSRDEASKLSPLPETPYEYAIWQDVKVGRDQHITFKGCFYSIPVQYLNQVVTIKASETMLWIYHAGKLIKTHRRHHSKGQWRTDRADINKKARHFLDNTPQVCLKKSEEIGPAVHSMLKRVLDKHSTSRLRKAQAILRLADKYSNERLESACAHALLYGNHCVDAIKRILIYELDQKEPKKTATLSSEQLSDGAYLRNPNEFSIH